MAKTKAQASRAGRSNYGLNYQRGIAAEDMAARSLRGAGYSVSSSPGSRGCSDLIARKGSEVRRIQVKSFSSRNIETPEAAAIRARSHPHNARRPPGGEIWVYDKAQRRYIIR
ncbi:MAG: hypothetical protein D5R99_01570 [Methanocalculus sp. MSAO_Arc1]|nr:MAG: hypothetical protein D5R99_01570 [Methanocalculus sp. MSAO_Arc1]